MEFVAAVDQASDFIVGVAIILNFGTCILEDRVAILGNAKAHIVLEVGNKFRLVHLLVLKEVRLLLKNANHHSLRVALRMHHAHFLKLLSILVSLIFL